MKSAIAAILMAACVAISSRAFAAPPVGIYLLDEHPSQALIQAAEAGYYDGITIQLRWSELQPAASRFDWSELDERVRTALRLGKKISVGIQAGQWTPAWLFAPPYDVAHDRVVFSWGRGNKCTQADIPRPWDPRLVQNMIAAWRQIATHLAATSGALAALTMVKVNGFNLANDQLRALTSPPRNAARGGCDATDGVELYRRAGFRPSLVVENWKILARGVAAAFPDTAIAIDVIPGAGTWPPIDDHGDVFDAGTGQGPDLTSLIVAAATAMLPGRVYVQANTLDLGPIPAPMAAFAAGGARLGLQTNAHTGGGANCGVKRQQIACDERGFAALLDHGMSLGAWFIEIHPNDAVAFPGVVNEAGAKMLATRH